MSIWSLQLRRYRGSMCFYFVHLAALEYQYHNTCPVILKHIEFEQPSLNAYPAAISFILLELKHVAWPRPCGKPITQLNTLNTNAHAHRCTNYLSVCRCSTSYVIIFSDCMLLVLPLNTCEAEIASVRCFFESLLVLLFVCYCVTSRKRF